MMVYGNILIKVWDINAAGHRAESQKVRLFSGFYKYIVSQ